MASLDDRMGSLLSGDLNPMFHTRSLLSPMDYPLRPTVARAWAKQRTRRGWCYLPRSFPVYRLQKVVAVLMGLLIMALVVVVAFLLVQITVRPLTKEGVAAEGSGGGVGGSGGVVGGGDGTSGGGDGSVQRKWMPSFGLEKLVRKLEDNPEYKKSGEEYYRNEDNYEEEGDEDEDNILEDWYEGDGDEEGEISYVNPVFDMNYFDFSIKDKVHDDDDKQLNDENRILENYLNKKSQKPPSDNSEKSQKPPSKSSSSSMKSSEAITFKVPKISQRPELGVAIPKNPLKSAVGLGIISDGIYFGADVEKLLEGTGMSDAEVEGYMSTLRTSQAQSLEEPTWNRCGRPKNQVVVTREGLQACARYRSPDDYLLTGEVLSFYLSRLLGLENVPPVILSQVSSDAWNSVSVEKAGWETSALVSLSPWIPGFVRDHMPSVILQALTLNTTLGLNLQETLQDMTQDDLRRVAQWSDLVVFDYLTGNYDRVASMQDAVEKKERGEEEEEKDDGKDAKDIMQGTIHNLVRSEITGGLWFIDNESGLMDAYELLYGGIDVTQAKRFLRFHQQMLNTTCLFRKSTVEAVAGLAHHPEPHNLVVHFAEEYEPLFSHLPQDNQKTFSKHFGNRIDEVYQWMQVCAKNIKRKLLGSVS